MSKIRIILAKIWDIIKKAVNVIRKGIVWMRADGLLHCFVSAVIFVFLARPCNPFGAAAITFLIGAFKEAYDEEHGGCCEWHDIICDLLGIALGVVIYLEYMVI